MGGASANSLTGGGLILFLCFRCYSFYVSHRWYQHRFLINNNLNKTLSFSSKNFLDSYSLRDIIILVWKPSLISFDFEVCHTLTKSAPAKKSVCRLMSWAYFNQTASLTYSIHPETFGVYCCRNIDLAISRYFGSADWLVGWDASGQSRSWHLENISKRYCDRFLNKYNLFS